MPEFQTLPSGAANTCPDCGVTPAVEVLKSAAGYYIGTQCKCGPYSRESLYYAIKEVADRALRDGTWTPREPLL
jgi:hypothetical protein